MQATLRHAHVSVMSIGSNDKRQVQRADALRLFKKGEVALLLVTDVAARGLDIDNLPLVVNAQLPERLKTYVHRTGRTGRMGKNGRVLNLGNDHDIRNLKRELGDKFTFVKADNTFEPSTNIVVKKQQANIAPSKVDSDSTQKPSITPSPSKKHSPVKVETKNDLPERKKKRAKHSKNNGKPKWAKKRD